MINFGLIGFGNIGRLHASNLTEDKIHGAKLLAVSDRTDMDPSSMGGVRYYKDYKELLKNSEIDAVILATPTHLHASLAVEAIEAGKHVLVEKPVALEIQDARDLIQLTKRKNKVAAVVLNQRTDPYYTRIRDLVSDGELGELNRIQWTMTNWFRPEIYFSCSPWRGTWSGEGGGALMNQCIHNIDIFSWIFGMPRSVRAECEFGKFHDIEVEDSVSAFFDLPSGAKAIFVGSTGEHPGVNRLEIVGNKGTIIAENRELLVSTLSQPSDEFSKQTDDMFGTPETKTRTEKFGEDKGTQHVGVLRNFIDALANDDALIGPLRDASMSVEIANAILLSSWKEQRVLLPLDGIEYREALVERKKNSLSRETIKAKAPVDMAKSFR